MFSEVLNDPPKKLQYESTLESVSNGVWHCFENPKPSLRFQTAASLLLVPYSASASLIIIMRFFLNNKKETLP